MKSIIIDSKEKQPWNFSIYGFNQEVQHLATGDYVIKGLEDILVIERKKTTGEISLNLGKKSKQFKSEMERMQDFKYRYLICEFTSDDLAVFPTNSGIPKRYWRKLRMNGLFMMSRLSEWCEKYDIELIFCKDRQEAEEKAVEIIKKVLHEEE